MKTLRLLCIAILFLAPVAAWGQQTISGTIIRSGTAPLTALASSGATVNQIPEWSGSAWTPSTLAVGSGLTLNFAGGTFTVSLSTPVGVTNGGTGQTSFTDGQLLIGDSSTNGLDKATLTAGSGITFTNGHGSITIASSGGGSGNPTDTATFGAGASYTFTQAYANTGIAPITLSTSNTYRLEALVNVIDTGGDDIRAYLYDSTQGYMIPWSEQRVVSGTTTGGNTYRTQMVLSSLYTPPASSDVIQLWATNATNARGTIVPYFSRITAEQVSGSSSQTQQSNTFPSAVTPVSHYDASTPAHLTLSGSNVTAWADTGSAGLTLSPSSADPTYITNAWNGLGMVETTASSAGMVTSSVPTTNVTFDMFLVCGTTSSTNIPIFENGRSSTGYQFYAGSAANSFAGGINASSFANTSVGPTNGFFLLELQRTSGGTTTFYVDGVAEGTSSSTPTTPVTSMVVGTAATILIGEGLLYNAPLSSANQSSVTNYLMSKWGL